MTGMPSITRTPSRSIERREAVEERVFAAVEKLLGEGMRYTEISVQRILAEAGLARSTFYAHFRDKSDLLARMAASLKESIFHASGQWDPVGASEGLPSLVRVFEDILRRYREHRVLLAAIAETAAYDPVVHDFYTADLDAFEARVVADVVECQSAGLTDPDIDPAATSRIVVFGGQQAIVHHIAADPGSGDAAFARQLAEIWWYGVYRRTPGGAQPRG
jgi:AcrR family transcriptional regulator